MTNSERVFGRKLSPEELDQIASNSTVSYFLFEADDYHIITSKLGLIKSRLWGQALASGYLPAGFESPDEFIKKIEEITSETKP